MGFVGDVLTVGPVDDVEDFGKEKVADAAIVEVETEFVVNDEVAEAAIEELDDSVGMGLAMEVAA